MTNELNFIVDVKQIGLEDGTTIPLTGKWDGSFATNTQFRGIKLDLDTTREMIRALRTKQTQTITIVCEIKRSISIKDKNRSWNMNVYEENK